MATINAVFLIDIHCASHWSADDVSVQDTGIDFLNPSFQKISVQESSIMTGITLLWGGTADIINI